MLSFLFCFFFRNQFRFSLATMSNVHTVNDIKKSRTELMRQLEMLTTKRAERDVSITRDLNRRINKLQTEIHQMTIKHRDEIKKCYSGSKVPAK